MAGTDTTEPTSAHWTPARISFRLALVLILVAMLLTPIWSVVFPPLLDYPNHLARSFVLAHLNDSSFTFSKFYRADWGAYPYLGMDATLALLDRLFPIETAGRVFLSLCALALPAAGWFFLQQINPGDDATALWTLLIASNVFFLEGFLNFDLSLAVGFVALGLWLRWLANQSFARWIAALFVFTILYFAHLLGFGIAGLIMVAYLALDRRPIRLWIWSGALALPSLFFYLHSSRVGLSVNKIIFHGLDDKLDSLGAILHGYLPMLDWISLAAVALWFMAAWWRNPEFKWNGKWLAIAIFLFALFWAIPWMWGEGSDLDIRVLPVLFVAILATARVGRRARWLAVIPLLLFTARAVTVTRHFIDAQPDLAGLARSFDYVPRGALVLPIVEGDQDPIERPFTHFWAYGVIRRGWFSPYLMDAPGQTPMRIIYDAYTPDGFWNLGYDDPLDWAQVQNDYDYVWAYDVSKFSAALAGIGEKVYSYGPLVVYHVRKSSKETPRKSPRKKAMTSPWTVLLRSVLIAFLRRSGGAMVRRLAFAFMLISIFGFASQHTAAQQASGGTWRFIASGDSRNCGDVVMPGIAETAKKNQVAFYWHLGDLRATYTVDEDILHQPEYLSRPPTMDEYQNTEWQDYIDSQIAPFGSIPFFLGIGNHELIAPKTREGFLLQFADWLDSPVLRMQRLKDHPDDHVLRTYFHWIDRGVAFYFLDNASNEQLDGTQLVWFESVLEKDLANSAVKTIVVGMHKALPESISKGHSMNESPTGTESGRRVYADLLRAQNDKNKFVYVLASHSHYYMDGIFNTDYWKKNGGVLPGWIVGTAGAFRYVLPPGSSDAHGALVNTYGSILGTVQPNGEISFQFEKLEEKDIPAPVTSRYGKDFVHWCFAENSQVK